MLEGIMDFWEWLESAFDVDSLGGQAHKNVCDSMMVGKRFFEAQGVEYAAADLVAFTKEAGAELIRLVDDEEATCDAFFFEDLKEQRHT
jgi:hypothetical protein